MKRFFSIVFVAIILLNAMGYYGIFLGLHYRNDLAMTKALDSDIYHESHVVTIKVPVSIPYMLDQADFERVNGKFEHQGELYRLVKQRYARDTLTVVCIKDSGHKKIDRALADYVKTFSDSAPDQKSSKITISFLKDYLPTAFCLRTVSPGWTSKIVRHSVYEILTPGFTPSIIHPPEAA